LEFSRLSIQQGKGRSGSAEVVMLLPWFGSGTSTLTFGIEESSVLNRTNLQPPSASSMDGTNLANASSSVVGVTTSSYQARIYQVVVKFQF
jgi:hypothetical protein